jgi:hypothetical protein
MVVGLNPSGLTRRSGERLRVSSRLLQTTSAFPPAGRRAATLRRRSPLLVRRRYASPVNEAQ